MASSDPIDITQIKSNQLLAYLRQGDLTIMLPENLPPFTIQREWQASLEAFAGKQFVRWVLEGIDRVLTHKYDPPWDCSGTLLKTDCDPLLLLARHQSLDDWAKNEYTGESMATYTSGMGLSWDTYENALSDFVQEETHRLLKDNALKHLHVADEWALFEDPRWDGFEYIVLILSLALIEHILQGSTAEAWKRFADDIRAENRERRQKAEQMQQMQTKVDLFWRLHFPEWFEGRIELPHFRAKKFEARITELLADTDPEIVEMIATMNIPGNYSNTVEEWVKQIARRALV